MNQKILLSTKTAEILYNKIKNFPIVDYHNHLDISSIKNNTRFLDIYDLWIKVDPYKHRALRMLGVDENLITGTASNYEKFSVFCEKFPLLVGNPLYVWCQMELSYIFDINLKINKNNARTIYDTANEFLKNNVIDVNYLLNKFNVVKNCPCFSLLQDISYISKDDRNVPSLRGDDFLCPKIDFINTLGEITNNKIIDLDSYLVSLKKRIVEFSKAGCVFSDHALDNGFVYVKDDGKNNYRFIKLLKGELEAEEMSALKSYILKNVLNVYSELKIVTQLHIGAQRTTSDRLKQLAGPAGGYAALGNSCDVKSLTDLFNDAEKSPFGLGKIVLFTLNPTDNELLSTLSGSYSKTGAEGLISQGPAWWWSDHEYAIKDVLNAISSYSLLSNFIGMTTDSRSFLSLIRHDYFRRVLCSYLGEKIENNSIPFDEEDIFKLLENVCYKNAFKLFD